MPVRPAAPGCAGEQLYSRAFPLDQRTACSKTLKSCAANDPQSHVLKIKSKVFPSFLKDGGAVGALMRAHDWSTHPLGEPAGWAPSLKTVVGLMLHSKTPVYLVWGPQLSFLYNDAYLDMLGRKHPAALGQPFDQVWAEIWEVLAPLVRQVFSGESVHFEDAFFTLRRKGNDEDEQAWFNFSYAPVHDLGGAVAGLYCTLIETTGQVQAQKHQREETRRLYSLFEQAPSFMAVVREPSHIYELANSAYCRLVGTHALIGKPFANEQVRVIEGKTYIALLDQVYATGKPFIGKARPLTLLRAPPEEGLEQRFIDFIFQPITGADGAVNGIFIEGSDVTAHVRTEDALRKNRRNALETAQRLDALLEAAPVGIILSDTQGQLLRVNPANRRLWGAHPLAHSTNRYEDWKGWWADGSARHGQPLAPHEWALARALHGEEAPRDIVEIEPFGQSGVRRTILNCGAPVRDLDGKIIGSVVAQMDITEQIRIESALRGSEARFRTMTNAMPQIVWSARPDGYHDYYNQQWYDYTGVAEGASDGQAWSELLYPPDRQPTLQRWQPSLRTGIPYETEYRLRHHSGQYRWVLARALPVRDEHGAIVQWMGTCTDIHAQKQAQEVLLQSDRRKDEFLAMLAHELRNPLAPITTAADLLAIGQQSEARVRQLSQVIARQAGHMTHLIDDLMDVSRVTRGLVTLEHKPVEMQAVVSEALEQVRPLSEAKAHQLQLALAQETVLVNGDKKRLVQVLANVLNNAVKYTPNGGHISLRMSADDSQVTLSVRDDGIGMSAELAECAFELFTQAERTSDRSQGGLGIGLALVKSLVLLHGGEVSAHSEGAGRGSEFTLVLPCLPRQAARRGAAEPARLSEPAGAALRVMVVDDNADAAQLLGMFLELLGHEVMVEFAPAKALERAAQALPEVCLLDIGLPDMDGYELAHRLRLIPGMEGAILAAVTGYGQPQDRRAAFKAGFNFHFSKPVDAKKLGAWLSEMAVQAPDAGMSANSTG
jgi:PAS domain S-box-containing protein